VHQIFGSSVPHPSQQIGRISLPRLEQFTTQLATLEAELSALPPVSEMDAEEVQGVSALRSALPRMIEFLRQEIVRLQADCIREERIKRLAAAA